MKAAQTIFRSASNFAGTLTLVLLTHRQRLPRTSLPNGRR